ncbi:YcxB family protein [Paenibacillus sp. MZ04-78.2]|uniref:YcxB family protein n=1 Tax=Paenibacillus sp. MZ04-78.2 TaxID=2962034 RepID=UPI0020B783EF|nr:YcxB family protein [Paenibacillus sp. MZ04-78.2]MCP3776426.1 YcxB family protein [Paenibacillus sp. MZ04-78.2]
MFAVFMLTGLISSSLEETLTPMFILSGIVTSLLVTSLSGIVTNYRLKSVFASDKLLQKEYFYLFDDGGISTESEVGNGKIKWCEVYKVKRNKKLHVIYVAKNKALIIPRSFFESLEQVKELESLLSDNLSVKQYKYR